MSPYFTVALFALGLGILLGSIWNHLEEYSAQRWSWSRIVGTIVMAAGAALEGASRL